MTIEQAKRWAADAGAESVVQLTVPPTLRERRHVDIDVRWEVVVPDGQPGAWMEMKVEVDGALEWHRRAQAHGPEDGMEHHARFELPERRGLVVKARVSGDGVRQRRLRIEALETAQSGDEAVRPTPAGRAGALAWAGSCLVLAGALVVPAPAAAEPVVSRGRLLYETHCVACHTQQIHWREQRLVKDWSSLVEQVRRWQARAQLDWPEADVLAVAAHLNREIYKHPEPARRAQGRVSRWARLDAAPAGETRR